MSARSLDLPQNLQRELFSLDSEIHGPALVRLAAGCGCESDAVAGRSRERFRNVPFSRKSLRSRVASILGTDMH